LVTSRYFRPVARFVTATAAPGIAPPDGSEMIPVIVAVSDCPNAPIAQAVKRSIA
jgi:hypothetical protein